MHTLIGSIGSRLLSDTLHNKAPLPGRGKGVLGLIIFAAIIFYTGIGFLIYAAHYTFLNLYTANTAIALTGCLIIAVAFLTACIAAFLSYLKYKRLKILQSSIAEFAEMSLDMAQKELAEPVKDNPKTALLLASVAGLVAGDKFL